MTKFFHFLDKPEVRYYFIVTKRSLAEAYWLISLKGERRNGCFPL